MEEALKRVSTHSVESVFTCGESTSRLDRHEPHRMMRQVSRVGRCELNRLTCKALLTLVILALCKQDNVSSLGFEEESQLMARVSPKHIETRHSGQVAAVSGSFAGKFHSLPGAEALTSVAAGGNHPQHETEEEATRSEAALEPPTSGPTEPHLNNIESAKLHIVRIIAPEAVQNGTQNVTLDCMFKFDRKLDQRLTIKWFFNDEVEPIYQWIPELNKRVYSDKYERFLDKGYEVSEDVDYLLQAYRFLQKQEQLTTSASSPPSSSAFPEEADHGHLDSADSGEASSLSVSRRLLAGRLSKLAKLGGRQSRQLIESLRAVLQMDQQELEFSRYRALRLIRPTTEMGGRYTCSVTSLDGDDFRTTKLVVYEPAKNLSFNVSRTTSQSGQLQYNITCQADRVFPRPSLSLFRYRAGPLESQGNSIDPPPTGNQPAHSFIRRPKLAATLLRQEPLASDTQVTVMGQRTNINKLWPGEWPILEPVDKSSGAAANNDIRPPMEPVVEISDQPLYEIISWTLVDEASLSSNVVSQFECLLTIEGTDYEQRQSLALQRGWHVNSAALESRHALVGLFGALASLLCLVLALVSSMLIFKLLRRNHAKNRRVHHQASSSEDKDDGASTNRYVAGGGGIATLSTAITTQTSSNYQASHHSTTDSPHVSTTQTITTHSSSPESAVDQTHQSVMLMGSKRPTTTMLMSDDQSEADGVYRVPASEARFGTRYFVEPPGSRLYYGPPSVAQAALPGTPGGYKQQVNAINGSSFHNPTSLRHQNNKQLSTLSHHEYISSSSKPLYC